MMGNGRAFNVYVQFKSDNVKLDDYMVGGCTEDLLQVKALNVEDSMDSCNHCLQ